MLFIRLFRLLAGYLRFRAEGGSPERFLNAASRGNLRLWDIRVKDGVLNACAYRRSRAGLKKAAGAAGSRLVIQKECGLPFVFMRYRFRKGIVAGVLLFFAVLWFFSGFIWTVQIEGNSRVSAAAITQALSDAGLRPGVFRLTLNLHEAENKTLASLPDLSWMSINLFGSTAVVRVKERVYPPLVPDGTPCNIRASQTGQIVLLETYEGMPVIRQGDTVKKGDLIVSGIIEEKTGVLRLVHASAKAVAVTKRELRQRVPFAAQKQVFTGKPITRRVLNLAGLHIPLTIGGDPQGQYLSTVTENWLILFGKKLPFSVRTTASRGRRIRGRAGAVAERTDREGHRGRDSDCRLPVQGKYRL